MSSRIRFQALLLAAPLLLGCADSTAPNDPDGKGSISPTPRTVVVRVDTVRTSPGVAAIVTLDRPGHSLDSALVLQSPIAGRLELQSPTTIAYTPDDGTYGEDIVSFQLNGPGRQPEFINVVFLVSAPPAPDAKVVVLREAAIPPEPLPERIRYEGVDLANPRITALRPLVAEILAAYSPAHTALDTARVLRDWVARTAVHPYAPFHTDGSTSNLPVLPPHTTWADVNALYSQNLDRDNGYWGKLFQDGPQMLDRLLGTQGAAGRSADGMMERVGPAQYRIRSLTDYHFVLCSYQSQMLIALWAAAGLQGMMVPTIGHDGSAVFIADLGKWVYMDPTYNEEYVAAGSDVPLSPLELVTYSGAGQVGSLVSVSISGPRWDRSQYIAATSDPAASYLGEHPAGFVLIGSQLNNAVTTPFGVPVRQVQLNNAALAADPFFGDQGNFARVAPAVAFPDLGVGIVQVEPADGGARVHLASTVPGHVRFQRRAPGGPWRDCDAVDFVATGSGRLEYRSLDATGASGMTALIEG